MASGKGGKDAARRPPALDPSPSGASAIIGMLLLGAILYAIIQAL
jgi:hypothetical protein